jgi:hypothetical protein
MGGRSLAFYHNRFVSSEGLCHRCEQEPLVGGVEKESLVSGVADFNTPQEDPIVTQLLPLPHLNMDLGARSLVSGVGCNDPKKIPKLEFVCSFSFLRCCDVIHHHASITLHAFVKPKHILYKLYFYFARMVL